VDNITPVQIKEFAQKAPEGSTHYNFNGTKFPYEKHERKNIFVWANGVWELTNVPSYAVPLFTNEELEVTDKKDWDKLDSDDIRYIHSQSKYVDEFHQRLNDAGLIYNIHNLLDE
jgi:hypothetical protein